MKCLLHLLALVTGSFGFNCLIGNSGDTPTTQTCPSDGSVTANSCVKPGFIDYTGPLAKFKCGASGDTQACVDNNDAALTAAGACTYCTTADCNTKEDFVTTSFNCLTYTFSTKWTSSPSTTQSCLLLKADTKAKEKTKCKKPKSETTLEANFAFAAAKICGGCPDGTSANCESYEPKTFECTAYSYDDTTTKWKAAEAKTSCTKISTTHGQCNEPKDLKGGKTSYDSTSPCGPCAENAGNCKTTSGFAMVTFSLLVLGLTTLLHF